MERVGVVEHAGTPGADEQDRPVRLEEVFLLEGLVRQALLQPPPILAIELPEVAVPGEGVVLAGLHVEVQVEPTLVFEGPVGGGSLHVSMKLAD